jgi:hypothetical protein
LMEAEITATRARNEMMIASRQTFVNNMPQKSTSSEIRPKRPKLPSSSAQLLPLSRGHYVFFKKGPPFQN